MPQPGTATACCGRARLGAYWDIGSPIKGQSQESLCNSLLINKIFLNPQK